MAKTKLTPERSERLIGFLKVGHYVETACDLVGIHKDTFYTWLKRGKEEPGSIYADFADAVTRAKVAAEHRMVASWQQEAASDWRAAKEFLARRYRKRWGPPQPFDSDVDSNRDNEPARFATTPEEAGEAVAAAIRKQQGKQCDE